MLLRRVLPITLVVVVAGVAMWGHRLASTPVVLPTVGHRNRDLDPGPPPMTVAPETLAAHYEDYQGKEVIVSGWALSGEGVIMPIRPWQAPAIWIWSERSVPGLEWLAGEQPVYATVKGRFTGAAEKRFGHQNCCEFKLEVIRVLSVDRSSRYPPGPTGVK